jgi:hypothetical protein
MSKPCSQCGDLNRYKQSSLCYPCFYERHQSRRQAKKIPPSPIDIIQGEVWIPIRGFENYYSVSNKGRIKTTSRFFIAKHGERYPVHEKILKQDLTDNGYLRVTLSVSEIDLQKRFSVHRLVAIHFISNPDGKPNVNHKDGNRRNNYKENLEWCTQKENIRHAIDVLGVNYSRSSKK